MSQTDPRASSELKLVVHTHRCQKMDLAVRDSITVMDLKGQVESLVGEGNLFRITGRSGNPGSDDEYKLVFHGQVLEDYGQIALSNLDRFHTLKKKLAQKQDQLELLRNRQTTAVKEAAEQEAAIIGLRSQAQAAKEDGDADKARALEMQLAAHQREQEEAAEQVKRSIDNLKKQVFEAKREESDLEGLLKRLETKCQPQRISDYYTGKDCMLHIVAAKATPGMYTIRVNYLGMTVQTGHCRCERVSWILRSIRQQHAHSLPDNSDDFKIRDVLYWRLAPSKMVRLDPSKCLCEYGVEDGGNFEHEIEKVPISTQAKRQLGCIKGKSKLKCNSPASCSSQLRRSASAAAGAVGSLPAILGPVLERPLPLEVSSPSRLSQACLSGRSRSSCESPACSSEDVAASPGNGDASAIGGGGGGDIRIGDSELYSESKSPLHVAGSPANFRRLEKQELRSLKRAASKAEKALKQAESKQRAAEAQAAAAQAAARGAELELERARISQSAVCKRALAAFERQEQRCTQQPVVIDKKPDCVVCLESSAEVVAYPCGHRCYCVDCADAAREHFAACQRMRGDTEMTHCPVCREHVADLIRVY